MEPIQESLLNLKINDNLVNKFFDMCTLMELFKFLRLLVDNKFDKSLFVSQNLSWSIGRVVEKLFDLEIQDYKNSGYLS